MGKIRQRRHKARVDPYPTTRKQFPKHIQFCHKRNKICDNDFQTSSHNKTPLRNNKAVTKNKKSSRHQNGNTTSSNAVASSSKTSLSYNNIKDKSNNTKGIQKQSKLKKQQPSKNNSLNNIVNHNKIIDNNSTNRKILQNQKSTSSKTQSGSKANHNNTSLLNRTNTSNTDWNPKNNSQQQSQNTIIANTSKQSNNTENKNVSKHESNSSTNKQQLPAVNKSEQQSSTTASNHITHSLITTLDLFKSFEFVKNCNNPKPSLQGRKIKDYKEIDNRALNAPKHVEINMASLVKYLTEPYSTVEEKSRAIFRWITNNISYDYEACEANNYTLEYAKDVFSRRKGMCGGYARLYNEMCYLSGVTSKRVVGRAKSLRDDDPDKEEKHAWSATQTEDGCWHLLDCTWASGHSSEKERFVKHFEDRYFFISPKELIYTHLPDFEEWQLLQYPVTKESFDKMAPIKAAAFNYGFCALSHKQKENLLSDYAIETINVSVNYGCSVLVNLKEKGNSNSKAYENAYHVTQKDPGKFEIQLMFPENNKTFEVLVFAKKGDESTLCVGYHFIVSPTATIFSLGFPRKYEDYYNYNVTILSKLDRKIITGTVYDFEFKVEGASEVGFMIGDKYTPFKRRDYSNIFYLNYKFEKYNEEKYSTRDLRVCVAIRHSNMYRYKSLLEYTLV
ncbi:hypothetical protein ABK040_014300 [Willaertia magna]